VILPIETAGNPRRVARAPGKINLSMVTPKLKAWLVIAGVAIASLYATAIWHQGRRFNPPLSFVSAHGRIEAAEREIATQRAGRIGAVLVNEGDRVHAGQIVVRMDTQNFAAERRRAEARLGQVREDRRQVRALLSRREAEIKQARTAIPQRESDLAAAKKTFERAESSYKKELIAKQQFDQALTHLTTAEAALAQERAKELMLEALLRQAKIQIGQRDAMIDAMLANIQELKNEIADSALKSPIDGLVLSRLVDPGEVLAAGVKVLTFVELSEIYMTVFLSRSDAERVRVGAEARIILDAAPQDVLPAMVSSVTLGLADEPGEAENKGRQPEPPIGVRLKIVPEALEKQFVKINPGLTGLAHFRLDPNAPWPEHLSLKLPN